VRACIKIHQFYKHTHSKVVHWYVFLTRVFTFYHEYDRNSTLQEVEVFFTVFKFSIIYHPLL